MTKSLKHPRRTLSLAPFWINHFTWRDVIRLKNKAIYLCDETWKKNTGSFSPGDLGVETLSQTPGDCGSGNTGGLTREDPQASINN